MDVGSDNAFAKMPSALVEEFSPTLPPGFPASKVPRNSTLLSTPPSLIIKREYLSKRTFVFV